MFRDEAATSNKIFAVGNCFILNSPLRRCELRREVPLAIRATILSQGK
jgi:hypothetical protein